MDSFKDIDMLEPEPEPAPLKWPKRQEFHTLIFFFLFDSEDYCYDASSEGFSFD